MPSISYTKTVGFLTSVFKKQFLLLQIPILLFISVPLFNAFITQDSSRNEGHLLVAKLQSGTINMAQFQQELAQLSKTSVAKNRFHLPLILLLCMKFFLYWCAIVTTMIIGLAYYNNRSVIIPSRISLARSAVVIFSYFFSIALFAFPVGFTIKILHSIMNTTLLVVLIIPLCLIACGLFLFLTSCFSASVPLILDTDEEIYPSIRKSYRMSKSQALYMLTIFSGIFIVALFAINLPAIVLARFLPLFLKPVLYKYAGGLLATITVMIFVAFYQQLTTPEISLRETMPPRGA